MVPSFDRLEALRECCRDQASFIRLQQILAIAPEITHPSQLAGLEQADVGSAAVVPQMPQLALNSAEHSATHALDRCCSTTLTRSNLLQGAVAATHQLLTHADSTQAIAAALAILGQAVGGDRVYIFAVHPHPTTGELTASQQFEWVQEAITPLASHPALQNQICAAHPLTTWYPQLAIGHTVGGLVRELPEVERQALLPDILSILVVPIEINHRLWGFMGLDDCHAERQWSNDEKATLQLLAASIGGAIAYHQATLDRQQAEADRQESETRYKAMLDASPDLMFRVNRAGQYLDGKGTHETEISPEQVVGRYIAEVLPPEVAELCAQAVQQTLDTGELQTCEYQLPSATGLRDYEARIVVSGTDEVLTIVRDVTIAKCQEAERRRVEAELRTSKERLHSFFKATFEAVIIHDFNQILDVNPAAEDLLGYTTAEMIGMPLLKLVAQHSLEIVFEHWRSLSTPDQPYAYEAWGQKQDGTLFMAAVSSKVIEYRGQKVRVASIRDITDRKQAEAALRLSEEKFSKAFRSSPNLMTIATLEEGRLIEVNESFLQAIQYRHEDVIGRTVHELEIWANPSDRLKMTQLLRQHGTIRNLECQFRTKTGVLFTALCSAEAIQIGGELCLIDVAVDITDRLRTEQQLWAAAERDRLLGEIALRIRQSLNLEQILNTTVAEVRQFLHADRVYVGHTDDQGLGQVLAESVDPQWRSILDLTRAGEQQIQEFHAIFAKGRSHVVTDVAELSPYPAIAAHYADYQIRASLGVPLVLNNQMFGLLVVNQCSAPRQWEPFEVHLLEQLATQVSIAIQQAQLYRQVQDLNAGLEQQVAERTAQLEQKTVQLQQKMEELQELNQLKDEFLNAFSHDLRTPVMGISLVINNLLNQGGDMIAVTRSILERMVQSSNHQLNLISSLLQAYSSETQGVILQYELVQLGLLTQVVVADLEPLIAKNQATFENRVPPDLPLVNADPLQLRRVFENLITNALHHNQPGIHLTLEASVKEEMLGLTIQDDGVGMTKALCDRLFERYVRGDNSRHTGIGLGLYLCRQIITAHGGQIGVHSAPTIGSTFWLTLPLAIPSVAQPNLTAMADV
jgi:PAS domain S-box-containing protein